VDSVAQNGTHVVFTCAV